MNNIKNVFVIKDLENLSGIKAHTIRIWEKRYNILSPGRSDSNIRHYSITDLQKLLNIVLLHNYGYKISKVAQISDEEMIRLIKEIHSSKTVSSQALNEFKMSMMNFDAALFTKTYESLLATKPFTEIFYEVFIPLLHEIGLLWQTQTIAPSHEHFISHQIRMRMLLNILQLQATKKSQDRIFVLFLPINEIHELGLLYLNYDFLLHGCETIYLGQSLPKENLKEMSDRFENVIFICHSTVTQDTSEITQYFEYIDQEVLQKTNSSLWLFGRGGQFVDHSKLSSSILFYDTIKNLTSLI